VKTIALTHQQAGVVDWALGAMENYATEEDNEGYGEIDLPTLDGQALTFPTANDELIDDLLYRLEEQYPDVCKCCDTAAHARAEVRVADNLASKIRAAFPEGANLRDMRQLNPDWPNPTSDDVPSKEKDTAS
jgi:hypothetical protein